MPAMKRLKPLKQSPTVSQAIAQHKVKVLSLYPDIDLAEMAEAPLRFSQ